MTHDGPQGSATALDKTTRMNEKSDIIFGSPSYAKFLLEHQGRVVVAMHGHAHDGTPLDKIDNVRVLNPGSLKFGEFAEVVLRENSTDATWFLAQYNKHYL